MGGAALKIDQGDQQVTGMSDGAAGFVTVRHAARMLDYSVGGLWPMVSKGTIPSVLMDGKRLIPLAYFDDLRRRAYADIASRRMSASPDDTPTSDVSTRKRRSRKGKGAGGRGGVAPRSARPASALPLGSTPGFSSLSTAPESLIAGDEPDPW